MKFLLPLLCCFAFASDITLKQIMDDPIWLGELPSNLKVSADGSALFFQVPQQYPLPKTWMKLDIASGKTSEPTDAELPHAIATNHYAQGPYRVYEINGDLWLSRDGAAPAPLLSRSGNLSFVRFRGEHQFLYRSGSNLYRYDLATGVDFQLTDFKMSDESKDKKTYYTEQEKKLLKYVAGTHRLDRHREENRTKMNSLGPSTKPEAVYLGSGYAVAQPWFPVESRYLLDASPDNRFISVALEPTENGPTTEYAQFINQEAFLKALPARPHVGHAQKTWKLGFLDRNDAEVKWLDLSSLPDVAVDRLAEHKKTLSEEDAAFLPDFPEGPRPAMLVPGGFLDDTRFLVTAIALDYKDRWIFLVNPQTMDITLIDHQHDAAWLTHLTPDIDAPNYMTGAAFQQLDGKGVAFLSDKTGTHHLYYHNVPKNKTKALTSGNWEVYHPYLSADGKHWYLHANKDHPGDFQFYRMKVDGGKMTKLTQGVGMHNVSTNENADVIAELYSRTNYPPVIRVRDKKGAWKKVYDGASDAFKSFKWQAPKVITYPSKDGAMVHSRVYEPANPNGAGVIFVHGAGYLQNAHKGWSGYFREYMFNNLLVQDGYTVLDPDFRASSGYGRDWRTGIYRHMGGKDLDDIVAGRKLLSEKYNVDAKRVGLYGGSYGGFIALMAMFTTPGEFQAGAALRPVTDWAYYNQWYVGRILNSPLNDPEAYRQSSPIYFAEGLEGHLLICHGMVDSNVHYLDSVRLAQRLMELGKENWELSSYPVEPHGFKTSWGWYDEYRRIHELFARTIKNK